MDISFWNKLNPEVEFFNTAKQYFNQYLWKLIIHADGGRLILSNLSLEDALAHRKNMAIAYNYGGSWRPYRADQQLDKIDMSLLESIQNVKETLGNKIRTRIEEPHVQFYAKSEDTLKEISNLLEPKSCIISVSGPENSKAEELLKSGAIIRNTKIEYKYKVIVRDGRYNPSVKSQLLQYLDNLGDEVKLSKTCRQMLSKTYPSVWAVFFYVNDPKLVTFINLIDPTLISNIHPVVNLN
jgi:hypothetical protein